VVCANVVGSSAVVAGTVKRATGVLADRTNLKLQVIDGGATMADQLAVSSQVGTDCAVPPPQFFHTVVDGNLVVHDR
jgi:galactitol-specific phosphotransferase system IIC component